MELIIGILGLALIVGFVVLMQKGSRLLSRKANQKVFQRRAHSEGQELVSQRLEFHARASVDDVRRAVLSTVKIASSVPAVIPDAHLIEAKDAHILYGYGVKLAPHKFRGLLRLEATDDGVSGSWDIINWTLADGVVEGQSVMKRLVADINTALKSVDPKASLSLSHADNRATK
jgi:hypothetical protein